MKSLTTKQKFLREMKCSFIGHKLKSSFHKRSNFDVMRDLEYEELPYELRQSGNPYYIHSQEWVSKCKCCRKRFKYYPLFIRQQLWRGIKYSILEIRNHFKYSIKISFIENVPLSLMKKMRIQLYKKLELIGCMISEFIIYQDWMYESVWDLLMSISFKMRNLLYDLDEKEIIIS